MSRVTRNTYRAAAASGLVLAALSFSACGDDSKDTSKASTPATTATTASTPTPALTTPKKAGKLPAVVKSKILVTKEGGEAIAAASSVAMSQSALDKQADQVLASLKKSGFPNAKKGVGSQSGPVVIQTGKSTTVLVYPSDQAAAKQTVGFALVLQNSKQNARMARDGNVLVATSAPKGLTPALKKEFAKARAASSQV